jgi:hypothetical protein
VTIIDHSGLSAVVAVGFSLVFDSTNGLAGLVTNLSGLSRRRLKDLSRLRKKLHLKHYIKRTKQELYSFETIYAIRSEVSTEKFKYDK